MKKIILALILFPVLATAQKTIIVHGDTLWLKNFAINDSLQLTKTVPTLVGQSGKVVSTNGSTYQWLNIDSALALKQPTITNGSITNAQLANGAVANLSGTNTGDNAANSTYVSDYRAANFVAGTNYLAPNGNGGSLTGLTATQVGLGNVNNTSDANKPVSTAQATAIGLKQDALVSGTNIKTVNSVSILGSGNQNISASNNWVDYQVAGSNATTTGQVLVDITGLVTGTLVTSSIYEFEAVLQVGTSAVTTGTKYAVNCTGTGATAYAVYTGAVTSTTGGISSTNALSSAEATVFLTTSGSTGVVIIKGTFNSGTGTPVFSIQHLKVTSGVSTVFVGSILKIRKL